MTVVDLRTADLTTQARAINPGVAILTAVATVLWLVGAVTWKVAAGVWFVAAWMFVAVRQGWRDARAASEAKRADDTA